MGEVATPIVASQTEDNVDDNYQKPNKGFFQRQKEFFVVKQELVIEKAYEIGLNEHEVRKAKKRLKEGWDLDIFGMFELNASSDGLKYEKKFFEDKNGSIETGVDDDGDPYFVLAIAF